MRSTQKPACVVCNGTTLRWQRAYRERTGIFKRSSVVQCAQCELLQILPMPSLDELDFYYKSQYRQTGENIAISPYDESEDLNYRTLSQMECIRSLGINPRSIVDIGCGYGLLLKALQPVFPQARYYGVEISEKCQPGLNALRIQLARTILEREGKNPFSDSFDLLTCSHVLEHSARIPHFLSICRGMVSPGGTVMFEVPNCEYAYGVDMPHLVFFTPKTLRQTMERSGFEVVQCRACGPTIERWLPGRGQRLRHWVDDHLPLGLARSLKVVWRLAKFLSQGSAASAPKAADYAKLREEAKDPAWFQYDQPGFKHSAVRCVAVRKS